MKKLALILSVLLVLGLTACSSNNSASPQANPSTDTPQTNSDAALPETDFPTKSVELIVPFAAGGGTDSVARALASSTEKYLGQPIVIVNRTGGSGAVGLTEGATAKNDGYKVTMITRELVTLPLNGLCSVTAEDYELISNINLDPGIVTVDVNSPYETIDDLIEAARANPDRIKFASTATPNMYVYTIQLNQDITFNHIPYNGAAESIPAVLGGHADFTVTSPGEALSQIQGGQLRALAVMSDERLESLPDVPTFKESGMDIVTGTWRGLGVPKDTPPEVVAILQDAFAQGAQDEAFIEFMNTAALNINYQDAETFAQFIADDTETAAAIFEAIG